MRRSVKKRTINFRKNHFFQQIIFFAKVCTLFLLPLIIVSLFWSEYVSSPRIAFVSLSGIPMSLNYLGMLWLWKQKRYKAAIIILISGFVCFLLFGFFWHFSSVELIAVSWFFGQMVMQIFFGVILFLYFHIHNKIQLFLIKYFLRMRYAQLRKNICLGDFVHIGKHCLFEQSVCLEDAVWIGNNVIVLAGITIGKEAIIASGSVVTKDVAPFSVSAGAPAKHLCFRELKSQKKR
jgi:hypothetical protein